MHWFWTKFFAAALECLSLNEGWWTFKEDSFAFLHVEEIAGGDEIVLDMRMHILNTDGFSACLQDAKNLLMPCESQADCMAVQFCNDETKTCFDM